MSGPARLSLATLPDVRSRAAARADVAAPGLDPRALRTGIVHLGLGAFQRAHQGVYTEAAAVATGDHRWGIHGATQRSARVRDALRPQDGLYGVLTLGREGDRLQVVGALREVSFPRTETARVLHALAAGDTHVVTLTVTEKGYRRAADGGPDLTDPELLQDLACLATEVDAPTLAGDPPVARTATGLLARGLAHRWRAGGAPVSVVCCDNLVDNGPQVRRLVAALVDACDARGRHDLAAWLDTHVRFPSTMVDRIVPATDDGHRSRAEALLGLRDEGLVVAEPFMQWVVEDDFAGPRPAWERAGATLTADVRPYEQAKLRLLNGTHSALAYAGALRGHTTIADAVADPELQTLARALADEDVLPTLVAPDGLDLTAYREEVLDRFANPGTGHTTVQVAMDGSQKLPIRLLSTVRDARAAGRLPLASARVVAAWIAFVRAASVGELSVGGCDVGLDDPMAAELAAATGGPTDTVADRVLDLAAVFGDDLAGDDAWRSAVRTELAEQLARPVSH